MEQDNSAQLLELIKHFGDIIKDLNGTFSSLSTSINSLISRVDSLPKLTDIDTRMNRSETQMKAELERVTEGLLTVATFSYFEAHVKMMLTELMAKMDSIESIGKILAGLETDAGEKKSLGMELEKSKIELQKEVVARKSETEQTRIKVYGDIIIKVIAAAAAIAGGVITAWQVFHTASKDMG